MEQLEFKFGKQDFNNMFPFYILVDANLILKDFGTGLAKICPCFAINTPFEKHFIVDRPRDFNVSFENLKNHNNQLIILKCIKSGVILRGQFQETGKMLVFIGSPWFLSMQEVLDKDLTASDFAIQDPSLDLLHVLNNQENIAQELKELLVTINDQKNKLKKDKAELNRLSLVASTNQNGVIFTEPDGAIFWCNDAYLKLTGYQRNEVLGKNPIDIGLCAETNKTDLKKMTVPFFKGEAFEVEFAHGKKDGTSFWSKSKGQPILDNHGKVMQYFAMIEDISLKRNYDRNLETEKEKYRSIIANMNLGLMEVNKKEVITLVNQNFCDISGYNKEELIGKSTSILLFQEKDSLILKEKLKLRTEGKTDSYEIEVKNKQGEKRNWLVSGAPNFNSDGKNIGSIGIHLDITESKRLAQQREILMESLAKSNEELEDYAQIVSHDLKSPLRSIHSLISWIKEDNDKEFNPQTTQYLSLIESKVEKMDHLIEGILTYSKIDKIKTTLEKVNTNEIIENIIGIIHIPSHINVVIKNKLPILKGDRFRIQQLFQNIISNAVNYNDKTTGLIEIGCEESTTHYTFYIKDNGPGIAKENHIKIFKIFQSFTKSEKSTGIGLSIVKKIIDSYNGKIWVESELNQGTTFFIKLPK
jgi:PAS domain S-box-containing protein